MREQSGRLTTSLLAPLFALSLLACGGIKAEPDTASLASANDTEKSAPLFDSALAEAKQRVRAQMDAPLNVPVPKDAGGGFTHEQHKRNYKSLYEAGILYEQTGDRAYADYARDMLLAYAALYPTLGEHPKKKEQTPGRLFWQTLNESVWLVYSIQGYEKIKEALSDQDRALIETDVFRRVARFLSEESPSTFNKVHNHGTWANAGVGMTGFVLGDDELVEQALLGLDKSGEAGFLKQLDVLFSPDGYYSEGPYYQRYALQPFVVFAQAIERNDPERKIFDYRDGILLKAINTTIHLSYNGLFFPINDALKEKGLTTAELQFGLAAAYALTSDPSYLSIAEYQNTVALSEGGKKIAEAIAAGKTKPFPFRSMNLSDGPAGDEGALAILRSDAGEGHQAVILKNTSQGMGHGHFDKLSLLFYDNGKEILPDYGAARFLNVVDKNGGHYLRENNSWAKQTIAHNTLVVDERSHFDGKLNEAEKHHPDVQLFDVSEGVSISRASISTAYPGVTFSRSVAQVSRENLDYPIVIDVLKVEADNAHQYDLPVHYSGQITHVSFPYQAKADGLTPLGEGNGYQHLWHVAEGEPDSTFSQITWLNDDRFYTYSFLSPEDMSVEFTRLGANDPDFNLRNETSFILRQSGKADGVFVSVLEPHGDYNPSEEYTIGSRSQISDVQYRSVDGKELVEIVFRNGSTLALAIADDSNADALHQFSTGSGDLQWRGPYAILEKGD